MRGDHLGASKMKDPAPFPPPHFGTNESQKAWGAFTHSR
jgi:hypothetical protein